MDLTLFPIVGLVFLLGASIGSFLNVVVYRLPAGLSLYPPSRCPHCGTRIRKQDNLPIIGWFKLKGRCAHCRAPISVRYPLVEALTAGLFLLTFAVFGLSWQTLGYWVFLSLLVALAGVDLDTMTLPNSWMKLGLGLGLLFQMVWGWVQGDSMALAINGLVSGIVGAVVGILLLDGITVLGQLLFQKPAMGDGDAYLAAMMGAWLGWKMLLLAIFGAALTGAGFGAIARLRGRMQQYQKMPFGPFLAIGSALTVWFGSSLVSSYRDLLGI
jgi:leader peptidase (prepilin peptidase)/N-methyltransferase